VLAADPERNNNFDYTVPGVDGPTEKFCPFIAHVRKTAPRNLDPYLSKQFVEAGSIVRAGVPYGGEVVSKIPASHTG
jgi:deferrochelatase/peroxidase EfeB